MSRLAKLSAALVLMLATWGLETINGPRMSAWLHPAGTATGPVRILRFYASVGLVMTGESAELCYAVENAKTVRISPSIRGVYPSSGRCLQVVPEHTTHYTILAEGYDGKIAMQSLTLPVQNGTGGTAPAVHVAGTATRPGMVHAELLFVPRS